MFSGEDYCVPVSGFYCKLCHKFYSTNEKVESHCKTQGHFERVKVINPLTTGYTLLCDCRFEATTGITMHVVNNSLKGLIYT